MPSTIKTTCPYCGVGCGILATTEKDGSITIKGDPSHPANFGRLCSKGSALGETIGLEGRLLAPEVDGKPSSWEAALNTVADRFTSTIEQYGPDSVAFYLSGQLLTEDYYVANKLMKGFIGSGNVDTNSRLCMSSAVAAYKRAFGTDTVPCNYDDIEQAELITLVGSNTAWCHPIIYQRIAKAKQENPNLKVVVIDPRQTATAEIADLHLPLKPGSDGYLFTGLLSYLGQHEFQDHSFTEKHCEGLEETVAAAMATTPSLTSVADACGMDREVIDIFFRWFSNTEKGLTLFSQGINQSNSGTDKSNAIINCHLFTGRIGKPGTGPFSITGQPNAMGGREVGGLANQLAAHMEIDNEVHRAIVGDFWNTPNLCETPGLKAVDLFEAVESGTIKAIWIMATNPAVSLPEADRFQSALKQCDLVVVSDCVANTDTIDCADIKLPATAWGEKMGTVTNSERRISLQRPFLDRPDEARPDWWIITQIARRMGFGKAFQYTTPSEIFSEYAALTAEQNNGTRDLDLGSLSRMSDEGYQNLIPTQWPVQSQRVFSDGKFFTRNGKARLIPVTPQPSDCQLTDKHPLILNSGRVRDQWHTMTRSGKSPRLNTHTPTPYVEIHPQDADQYQISDGNLATISSEQGIVVACTVTSPQQQRGSLFIPIHWSGQNSHAGKVGVLVDAITDPISGQPQSKQSAVSISPYPAQWYGFLLSRREVNLDTCGEWNKSLGKDLWRYQIAGETPPENWSNMARSWLCSDQDDVGWTEYFDTAHQLYRSARFTGQQLDSCLYIGTTHQLPEHDWIESLFVEDNISPKTRSALLSGSPPNQSSSSGPVVCACFGVSKKEVETLITTGEITTVEEITAHLKAGGNCGSCLPELRQLLDE